MRASLTLIPLVSIAVGLAGVPVSAQIVRYHVTPLGALPGPQFVSVPHALNDLGQVAGISVYGTLGAIPFFWDPIAGMTPILGFPGGGVPRQGEGINNLGQVVGVSSSASGTQAFVWSAGGGTIGLGDLPGGIFYSWATGINDYGVVTGWSQSGAGQPQLFSVDEAFIWSPETGMVGLGDLPGGDFNSHGLAINNLGQVTGWGVAPRSTFSGEALIWDAEHGMRDLGTVPGGGIAFDGAGINNLGQICGTAATPAGSQAHIWDEESGFTLLGVLPGPYPGSGASALNDRGVVVGRAVRDASLPQYVYEAFVWDAANGMRPLTDLVDPCTPPIYRDLKLATAVNNRGQITAYPRLTSEGVLLTPYLVGDLDNNGRVDLSDLLALLANFGRDDATFSQGDSDCDNDVDLSDLTQLLSNFGATLP